MKKICFIVSVLIPIILYGCDDNKLRVEKTYFEDGSLESEISKLGEKLHGDSKYYYPDGKLELLVPYKDDKAHGKGYLYRESGELLQTKDFVNDKLHGQKIDYFKNGKISIITNYVHDTIVFNIGFFEDGDTMSFYDKGRAVRFFENGKIEQITCSQNEDLNNIRNIRFSPDGKIIKREEPLYCLTKKDSLLLDKQYPNWKRAELNTSAL